jgi:hypothetical protein
VRHELALQVQVPLQRSPSAKPQRRKLARRKSCRRPYPSDTIAKQVKLQSGQLRQCLLPPSWLLPALLQQHTD